MKRLIPLILAAAVSVPAMAGLAYKFESVTAGLAASRIAGTVQAEGRDMRIDITGGDGMMFKSGTVAISRDGGGSVTVLDPSTKSYYVMNTADLAGGGSMLETLRKTVAFRIENDKVGVRDAGNGGTLEGYATRKSVVDASFDIVVNAMGQNLRISMAVTTETWATPQIGAEYANLFQQRGFRTGIEQLDKVIAAQGDALKGFPIKQVATVRVKQNATEMTNTTTTTVSAIQRKAVAATMFAIPSGYRKVASPVEAMLR